MLRVVVVFPLPLGPSKPENLSLKDIHETVRSRLVSCHTFLKFPGWIISFPNFIDVIVKDEV
jgi:hypothetical protein